MLQSALQYRVKELYNVRTQIMSSKFPSRDIMCKSGLMQELSLETVARD
jgi:hypothetical protein